MFVVSTCRWVGVNRIHVEFHLCLIHLDKWKHSQWTFFYSYSECVLATRYLPIFHVFFYKILISLKLFNGTLTLLTMLRTIINSPIDKINDMIMSTLHTMTSCFLPAHIQYENKDINFSIWIYWKIPCILPFNAIATRVTNYKVRLLLTFMRFYD